MSNVRLAFELLTRLPWPRFADYEAETNGAVAVIAVPFNCYLHDGAPDNTNEAIAFFAKRYMARFRIPFFGQFEHANLLRRAFPDDQIIQFASESGQRVQTQDLLRWTADQVLRLGKGNKVILIGMPEHLGRVALTARYFGLDPVIPNCSKNVPYDPSDRPGAQGWCKSRVKFVLYECLARPVLALRALQGKY